MGIFGTVGSIGGMIAGNIIAPGLGTAIGGALGGALGTALDPQDKPEMSEQDRIVQNQTRAKQAALAAQLQAQANGEGPNLAQQQFDRANNKAIQQSAGFAASQKGLTQALSSRLAAQNQAGMSAQAAEGSGIMRAQQQIAAQGQLANLLTGQQSNAMQSYGIDALAQMAANQRNGQMMGGLLNGAGAFAAYEYARQNPLNGSSNSTPYNLGGGGTTPSNPYSLNSGANINVPQYQMPTQAPSMYHLSEGGPIPGKASVPGNSVKNDTVPAMLSPGEVVLPRTVSKNPELAKEFVQHIMGQEKKKNVGYEDIIAQNRELKARLARLEKKVG